MTLTNSAFKTLLSILICLTVLTTTSANALERWQRDDYLIDSFVKIALKREYKETATPTLVRWENPIHVYFDSDAGNARQQEKLLKLQTRHLSYITGVPIDFTTDPQQANVFAIFTHYNKVEDKVRRYIGNPEKLRKALDEAICLGNFSINRRYEIRRGVIIIPIDYARQKARFIDCIVEEITQLMGLPNDSDDVFPSVFNDVSVDTYLTPLDYLLLKILYSPHLRPGMNEAQVRQRLPNIIDHLYATGDLKQAVKRVQNYSLKQYLGE